MVDLRTKRSTYYDDFGAGGADHQVASRREVTRRLNEVIQFSRVNWAGEVTLEVAALTTTVDDPIASPESVVLLMPMTLNAKNILPQCHTTQADLVPGTDFGTSAIGEFTINHPNPLPADCLFRYAIIG